MATQLHGGEIVFNRQQFTIDENTITYDRTKANGSEQTGRWVSLSADMTIQLAADGEGLVGKLEKVDGKLGTVAYNAALIKADAGDGITLFSWCFGSFECSWICSESGCCC